MTTATSATEERVYLTSGEVAARFGLTSAGVRKAAREGRIPFVRLGPRGQRRFRADVVERLLKESGSVAA